VWVYRWSQLLRFKGTESGKLGETGRHSLSRECTLIHTSTGKGRTKGGSKKGGCNNADFGNRGGMGEERYCLGKKKRFCVLPYGTCGGGSSRTGKRGGTEKQGVLALKGEVIRARKKVLFERGG